MANGFIGLNTIVNMKRENKSWDLIASCPNMAEAKLGKSVDRVQGIPGYYHFLA